MNGVWMEWNNISQWPEDSRICWVLGIGSRQAREELVQKIPKPVLECRSVCPSLFTSQNIINEPMRSKNIKQQENTAAGLSMLEECSWKLEGLHSSAKRTVDRQLNTGLKQRRRNLEYIWISLQEGICLSMLVHRGSSKLQFCLFLASFLTAIQR